MGSGHGKTATRGSKGQRSRSGARIRPGFEGGQMPLHRRLPKRGFTNIFKKEYALINLGDLENFPVDEVITPEVLKRRGLVKGRNDGVKVLGDGELKAPLRIAAHAFSKSAREKLEKAGGAAEIITA
jgi:large subunit ribosomal protein L15